MRAKGAIWHFLVFGVIAICLGVVLTVLSAVDILPDSSSRAGAFWSWLTCGESGSATLRNVGLLLLALVGLPFAMWRHHRGGPPSRHSGERATEREIPDSRRDGGPRLPNCASRRHRCSSAPPQRRIRSSTIFRPCDSSVHSSVMPQRRTTKPLGRPELLQALLSWWPLRCMRTPRC